MRRTSPFVIRLSGKDRKELEGMARRFKSSYRDVIRAKIVLIVYRTRFLGHHFAAHAAASISLT